MGVTTEELTALHARIGPRLLDDAPPARRDAEPHGLTR
jgi:hypothetical protein